ncbi:hypothetical protein B7P43_G12884 [Cryptotermes secundus]|uniref:Cadherin domain-containing protein n=1 Tax=Cryptotermes secundus TaxID=105785 RepID=A0A2J7PRM2_9NEOP|nr:cadherin-99C isoform X3 [Cryptotermes secundus]PNF18966.1 hypothetical protein B7P43_G12884 [Cryptotermes secundus]
MPRRKFVPALWSVLFAALLHSGSAKPGLCEVETGQSNIILDIEESRGTQVSQSTSPVELPIVGDPFKDVTLDLVFPRDKPVFILNGKKLQLLEPLDRDEDNLSHIVFQLTCTVKATNKKRSIPVIVRVSDNNDNAPHFENTPYETTVSELTPVGTTIFQGVHAKDVDAGVNGLVEYFIVPGDGMGLGTDDGVGRNRINVADGFGYFSINLPHQGQVTVNRSLDFERTQRYLVTIVASDRARNVSERFSTTTTLTVNVRDDDDQNPSFIYQGCMLHEGSCINPEYSTSVSSGKLAGILNIYPEKIQAVDMDSINAPIKYSFLSGTPSSYKDYFEIDEQTGAVRQKRAVDTSITKKFEIIVKAEEVSEQKRSATAKLFITVKPVDSNPPVINASATEGFADENAPVGTKVVDKNGNPIRLAVTDEDLGPEDPKPSYSFEMTTSFFTIDNNGYLTVNVENLDRDPPSPGTFRFQIVAREKTGSAASAPLSMSVSLNDVNDNAPKLPMIPPLTIQAGENKQSVTKVEATDADLGANAEITYSIYHVSNNGRQKFKIDRKTGLIETTGKLNAGEQYSITVQATDTGGKYSQTIVEVTVVPGPNTRGPIFENPVYEVQVSEGASINSTVTTVNADDPDTNQKITYIIKQGSTELFSIDPKTGIIITTRGLDYEKESQYILVVGTLENPGTGPGATTRVIVNVLDRNDIPPVFTAVPRPVTLNDDVPIGTTVTTLIATDSDGTSPGNKVRYELVGRGKAQKYFQIDSDTGVIQVRDDLRKETSTEYEIAVKAYDLGEPQLSSVTSVHVYVRHVATVPPDQGIGFADNFYTVEVPENATTDTLIKTLTIINNRAHQDIIPLKCDIIQGNEEGLFYTSITEDRNCDLRLKVANLDHEKKSEYQLQMKLDTLSGLVNPSRSIATVKVNVVDVNDNRPHFIFPNAKFNGKYFGALPVDSQIGTIVLQVKAEDADSGKYSQLSYHIVPNSSYFKIDETSGIITTTNTFSNVDLNQLPFKFNVAVRDNPDSSYDSFTVEAPVVINLISDQNRLILVIDDAKPKTIQHETNGLVDIMEDNTNLVIGIEKVAVKQYLGDNGTIEQDNSGTDVWFYAIDPDTDKILDRNSTRIQRSILSKEAVSRITVDVTGNLHATASSIHPPLTVPKIITAIAVSWEVFPYALIVIACIILVLGIVGIIYICISWSRYKAYKERMQRMYVVPRYDPVFVEPNLKEYETQVLQMSVPLDDSDSYNDLQLDFSGKNHAFSLDNVSYITKENGDSIGQQSPVSSDAATTARASSIVGGVDMGRGHSRGESDHNNLMGHDPPLMPVTNPMYQRSSEEDIGHMNASATNENVTFREKRDYSHLGFTYLGDRSPVETTTEL